MIAMKAYLIAVASTADLPDSFFACHNVPVIRYSYAIGMEEFADDCREDSRQLAYADMRSGTVYSTSMITAEGYAAFFRDCLATGKDVIFLDMSREMSSSYRAAQEAAERVRAEFPEQTLYVMDTLCISGGLGLLATEMVRRQEDGMSFAEVIAWGEANKLHIMHRFTVDDLHYLKRGGRVSNASAMVGSMLSIKPVLYVPDDGKLTVAAKVRGRKAALQALIDGMQRDFTTPDGQTVHILQADCMADAEWVRDQILVRFPTVKNVVISGLGIIIGAHCGPGLLTVFYFGAKRQP